MEDEQELTERFRRDPLSAPLPPSLAVPPVMTRMLLRAVPDHEPRHHKSGRHRAPCAADMARESRGSISGA